MRKGRDGEWKKKNGKNNDENSGPLTSLPVDRLTACSTATPPLVPITVDTVVTNVVASRPPNADRMQRQPLVPIVE